MADTLAATGVDVFFSLFCGWPDWLAAAQPPVGNSWRVIGTNVPDWQRLTQNLGAVRRRRGAVRSPGPTLWAASSAGGDPTVVMIGGGLAGP